MIDITYLFRLKRAVESGFPDALDQVGRLINDRLYPTEYDNERKYTAAFIQLMNQLMTELKVGEEEAYRMLYVPGDPEQCSLDEAIEDLEWRAKKVLEQQLPRIPDEDQKI